MSRFQETEDEVEVRREDQDRINEFGIIHRDLSELKEDKKIIEEELSYLEDAEQEVMLAEGSDSFMIRMGSTYVKVGEDEFNDFLEKRKDELEQKKDKIDEEVGELESKKSDLKASLYARFGKTINLDD